MPKPPTPTLDELLQKLQRGTRHVEQCRELYRQVASGERHPTNPPLPDNIVLLACQAMTVLFKHLDKS